MQLQQRLDNDADTRRELVRVVDGWYEVEEDGWQRPMPVLHYHGRTEDGEYRHWAVEGFRPYFYVARDDLDSDDLGALDADRRVVDIIEADRTGIDSAETDIPLVKVVVECPWHVKELRSHFPRTWEADVLFPQRHLIDQGVSSYLRLPVEEQRVTPEDVGAVDDPETDIHPRVAMWDIEVIHDGDSMPEPSAPKHPITAVTLYDSYQDEYTAIVLRGDGDGWSDITTRPEVTLKGVGDERDLIKNVVAWFRDVRPDVLSGWNANAFDWPYFVNRAFHLEELLVERISPTGHVFEHDGGGRFVNSDVGGIHLVDLMDAYEKSQYTELKSKTLEHVASKETDLEKLDVDEQWAYRNDPQSFVEYSVRDVEACVEINREQSLL